MLCPICGSETNPHRVPRYRACPSCSHAFLAESPSADHLAQVYGDDYFTAAGAGYADYLAEGALLRERGRRYGPSRATESDGAWLVETWNGASFTARLFGPNWHEWSPPSVRHVFTPQSLDRLAASYGMSRIASGRPKKTLIASHAKSLLKEKALTSFPARVLALAAGPIPNDVTLPYPAEDLFWALYRG